MADELHDVSVTGVRLRLWLPVHRGERLTVTLWGPKAEWCGRGLAIIRWAKIGQPGKVLAGIRLNRRLSAEALRTLAVLPVAPRPPAKSDWE